MSNRSRFGKYGEIKRLNRLRQAGNGLSFRHESGIRSLSRGALFGKAARQKAVVRIRPAKASDAHFVAQLGAKVFWIYGPYEDMVPQWFESKTTLTLIASMERKPVGFAMIGHLADGDNLQNVAELLAIAVEPEKQGMGIGEILIKKIEGKAAEHHVRKLFLHTAGENVSAQRLFRRVGYSPCGTRRHFYPAGQDGVEMFKEIPRAEE